VLNSTCSSLWSS